MAQSVTPGIDLASFAQLILINMPSRAERLADSLAELSRVVGRPIEAGRDVHVIRPVRFDDAGGFANAGYRSNLHAHLQAANLARGSGQQRALVLEDDVAFGPEWPLLAGGLLQELSERPWDLANLGYLDEWGEGPSVPDDPLPGSVSPERPAGAGWARFAGRINGAHAYLLHCAVLDDWIDHLETVLHGSPGDDLRGPMPSDGAINTFFWIDPGRVRLVAAPNLVGTRPTRSDIDPGRLDRLPIVGQLAEVARRWLRRRGHGAAINYR